MVEIELALPAGARVRRLPVAAEVQPVRWALDRLLVADGLLASGSARA